VRHTTRGPVLEHKLKLPRPMSATPSSKPETHRGGEPEVAVLCQLIAVSAAYPMATYIDPTPSFVSSSWGGSDNDDTLIYQDGNDAIDGRAGYDVLSIPYSRGYATIGAYYNGTSSVYIKYPDFVSDFYTHYKEMRISITGIEQVQFSDELVTLEPRPAAPVSPPASVETSGPAPAVDVLTGFALTGTTGRQDWFVLDSKKHVLYNLDVAEGDRVKLSGPYSQVTHIKVIKSESVSKMATSKAQKALDRGYDLVLLDTTYEDDVILYAKNGGRRGGLGLLAVIADAAYVSVDMFVW